MAEGVATMASSLVQRLSLYNLVGKLFGGNRDLYKVFGYDKAITYEKCIARYRRQDIASRIIDAPADALWANPPTLTSTNEEWNTIWQGLVSRNRIWNAVSRVDRMAGMGDFAVLLFGFDNTSKLVSPATKIAGRKLLYLQPYSIAAAEVKTLVTDPSSARYLLPETYAIKPSQDPLDRTNPKPLGGLLRSLQMLEVHESRILHVAEGYLQDTIYGNPRMDKVYNLLDDVMKVAGGTAETFWLASNRGMHVDVDREMELTPDDEADLTDEIEEYVHQLRRVIRTRGVKVQNLGSDTPDPQNAFAVLLSLISGATGIPKRILLGSEAGQLASSQDRNNWAERIEERRTNFGEPVIIYPLVRTLTEAGVLPEADIQVKWPDAFKLSPLERAQTAAQKARSATNLAKAMDTNENLFTVDEAREILELTEKPDSIVPDNKD